ncbi:MAG: helix-turn-helix domain-containing protein [Gemmatimonadota bacterium]
MIAVLLLFVTTLMRVRLVKADEAAPVLGISRSTLLAYAAAGKVAHYRFGHAVRFDLAELLESARRGGNGREPPPDSAKPARGGGPAVLDREERTTQGARPHG